VRVVDYNQGAFALLIEAVGDSSWYSLSDGELFQVSLFDETIAVVIENGSQAVHGAPESSGPRSRISTGFPELDHVLGGGLVKGSTALLAGWPGTGRTTLTLQMLNGLGCRCLYVTGEETREQVVTTAQRISAMSNRIHVFVERRLEEILAQAQAMHAQALAIDTIQMLSCGHVRGRPGLPAQLRACMARLIDYARTTGTTLWLVGHLTACGDIAGPRTIVHDVDIVLRLDQEDDRRILSCPGKNRFGPTNLVGRFRLTSSGFIEVGEEASTPIETPHGASS
jgi:DNA repair protein RadA/Sms